MSSKKQTITFILLLLVTGILLSQVVDYLESHNHPLLSSLTCLETENREDLYWTVNRVGIAGVTRTDEKSVTIILKNTIPNFAGYLYRTDVENPWQRIENDQLVLDLEEWQGFFEVRGTTLFGEKLAPANYRIALQDGGVIVDFDHIKIVEERFGFSFEKVTSPKVRWLQGFARPAINGLEAQWDRYTALRTWVREQIPYKDPAMKSEWDAQKILQSVWKDPAVGFICDAFAATYVSACASVGLNARMIHLGDDRDFGHYATEIWSDDYQKWVFMDPLYNCHFILDGQPLSAVELRELWKRDELEKLEKWGKNNEKLDHDMISMDYFNLLRDIQVINGNNFLTSPHTSVLDLLTFRIRYVRLVDETNPPYNRVTLSGRIVLFYYLPKLLKGCIIPFVIPGLMLFFIVKSFRKKFPEYLKGGKLRWK
jgi:hypothetical protein